MKATAEPDNHPPQIVIDPYGDIFLIDSDLRISKYQYNCVTFKQETLSLLINTFSTSFNIRRSVDCRRHKE